MGNQIQNTNTNTKHNKTEYEQSYICLGLDSNGGLGDELHIRQRMR